MEPLTAGEIRSCFVNASKGEAKRLQLPRDLAQTPWADLDFLAWSDPAGSDRIYLVVPHQGRIVGIFLRQSRGAKAPRKNLCSVCLTSHNADGVRLTVAPRVGDAGKRGNTVGLYLCADLACSLYVRGKKTPPHPRFHETITTEQAITRLQSAIAAFVDRVVS